VLYLKLLIANKLCSRDLLRECQFYLLNSEVAFLRHPLGDIRVTYAIHPQLVGKLAVDIGYK